jgi:hypothetical protein
MVDIVSITALVIAVFGAGGHFIKEAHIKKCKMCFCCESDCTGSKKTPPETPIKSEPINYRDISHC